MRLAAIGLVLASVASAAAAADSGPCLAADQAARIADAAAPDVLASLAVSGGLAGIGRPAVTVAVPTAATDPSARDRADRIAEAIRGIDRAALTEPCSGTAACDGFTYELAVRFADGTRATIRWTDGQQPAAGAVAVADLLSQATAPATGARGTGRAVIVRESRTRPYAGRTPSLQPAQWIVSKGAAPKARSSGAGTAPDRKRTHQESNLGPAA